MFQYTLVSFFFFFFFFSFSLNADFVMCAGQYTTTGAMLRPLIHAQTDASFVSLRDDQTKVGL